MPHWWQRRRISMLISQQDCLCLCSTKISARKWDILQNFYWFINNCTFHFSADSICYILWCDSEGLAQFAPGFFFVFFLDIYMFLWEMLTASAAQCTNQNYSSSSSSFFFESRHSQLQTCLFPSLLPVCSQTFPWFAPLRPTDIFQEYW